MYIRAMVYRIMALFFALTAQSMLFSQSVVNYAWQNFDGPAIPEQFLYYEIDTISNPGNIWEVGEPNKTYFDTAYSGPNAIVTDLDSFYPVNDTSSFTMLYQNTWPVFYGNVAYLSFYYKIDADSGKDYGLLECSIDSGTSWFNPLEDELIYKSGLPIDTSIFTGKRDWSQLTLNFEDHPMFDTITGTSFLMRFTFYSDSIQDNRDGWMLDDIEIQDGDVGISEFAKQDFQSLVFPNPSNNVIQIEFDNPTKEAYRLHIYNDLGQEVLVTQNVQEKAEIDIRALSAGLYHYKLVGEKSKKVSVGKILKEL